MPCPSFPGCSQASACLDDIQGSAPVEQAYLIVEQAKPWPAKIKKMDGLIQELKAVLKSHQGEDFKLLATPEIPWLEPSESPRALTLRWDGKQALVKILKACPRELQRCLSEAPSGEPDGLYLVCTHGSRDPCCGLVGVPVHRALAQFGTRHILQVSHLGGHRFAPVVGVFPEWRFYGHLNPNTALEMDKCLAQGKCYLKGYRGCGRYKSLFQVAEAKIWEEHGTRALHIEELISDKNRGFAKALVHLDDGSCQIYEMEFESYEFEGYKSCKDLKKEKESVLKLPRLSACRVSPAQIPG